MSLTYSITGLLVVLGLLGKHNLAAEVAIVQGAVLATFYVLSGDARHLILTEQMKAEGVAVFRLIWVIPLGILAYIISVATDSASALLASALVLRRATEWLAEVHVTELERTKKTWHGWYLQPVIFLLLAGQIIFTKQLWIIWVWAVSPLFFSFKFLLSVRRAKLMQFKWEYVLSTAVIGFTGYLVRILVISLAGKEFAGMVFPGYALGSFVGSMAANVAGSSLFNSGVKQSRYFFAGLLVWSLLGAVIYLSSGTVLYQTLGLSVIGGAVMILAQKARLSDLSSAHTLSADLLLHLMLVFAIPVYYYAFGRNFLVANYLLGAVLAWFFYGGYKLFQKFDELTKKKLAILITIALILPLFIQLSGQVYNNFAEALIDSGGSMLLVPLPISLFACYAGLLIFGIDYQKSKSIVLTIVAMFLIMTLSTMVSHHGIGKLILSIQFIVPTAALLLGLCMGGYNRNLMAKTVLYFLVIFVPAQLLATWFQGQLALTHYMYLFSVYQHYQYVPLMMVALFAWVWIELRCTHTKWIYFLSPLLAMYVAAGNSVLALFGLVVFVLAFAFPSRKRLADFAIPALVLISVCGYLFSSAFLSDAIAQNNEDKNLSRHGVFVGKFFDKSGRIVSLKSGKGRDRELTNITDRIALAKLYINSMLAEPSSLFIGHASPPARSKATSAHNYYLDLVYNFGLLSTLPLFILLIFTIQQTYQFRHDHPEMVWLCSIVLYLVVIDSNLKVTLRQPYPGIIAFLLWGILISRIMAFQETKKSRVI